MTTVRTRFAPSPTGLLHIGNARAGLFNYLFARHMGGQFLLRIEDTDKERSTQEAVDVIFDGLKWLGLDWDEEPVFQAANEKRHQEVVHQLLKEGKAYKCYATPEELTKMREEAKAAGKPPRYNGMWRDREPGPEEANKPYAIRLKAPQTGSTTIHDLIQGDVTINHSELDDMILLRSDGTPIYLLAVVVDDHDMGITHVMRGDDHLVNTFRQKMIYDAMGWETPKFAHLPLIHGPDGAKLSKRHGAQSVVEFREQGILPEALCNYLLRLGWGHGDDEILSRQEQIDLFTIEGCGKSPSRMDYAKLENVNGVWIRRADDKRLCSLVMPTLINIAEKNDIQLNDAQKKDVEKKLMLLLPHLKERAKTLIELADSAAFLLPGMPKTYIEKTNKFLDETGISFCQKALDRFKALPKFEAEPIHDVIKQLSESEEVGMGKIAQPLRAAMTGTTTSPGIDVTLEALGLSEVENRIEKLKTK